LVILVEVTAHACCRLGVVEVKRLKLSGT
jgi:hypothetical protein